MTKFEFSVSTIGDDGTDRTEFFRAAIMRPIEIFLPTANGNVSGYAKVLSIEGTVARLEGAVDDMGAAQLEDLVGSDDWRQPVMQMFGSAVRDLVFRRVPAATPAAPSATTAANGTELRE